MFFFYMVKLFWGKREKHNNRLPTLYKYSGTSRYELLEILELNSFPSYKLVTFARFSS